LPARRRPPVSGQVCSGGRAYEAPLGLRSWSNWRLTSIGLAYDGAKRPVSLSIGRTGQSSNDTIGRTYDLDGNVASETQTLNLTGGSGSPNPSLAYSGVESYTYDAANRVKTSSFGGSIPDARAYTYDADGNRTIATENGVTFYYWYDANDELIAKGPNSDGSGASAFTYDHLGNLLTSQPAGPDSSTLLPTTYTYDPAGHLLTIDDGTAAQKVVFVIDAAGRHASQTIGSGATTSYEYLGTSDQISSECSGGVVTYSAIDAIGDRLSQGTAGSVSGYLIADLHGNIVAALGPGASPLYLSAYRYDPYGETVGLWSASSGLTVPWRFGGRILESDIGSGTDLYDFGARSYDPSLGAFTSFDSVAGSAQNPLTLNRYLYASANPATLVDPDGHRFMYDEDQSIGEKEQIAEERQALADDDTWDRSFSIFHTAPSDPLASLWTQVGNNEEHQFSHRKVLSTTNTLAAVDRKAVLRDSQTAAGAASRSNVDCKGNPFCIANNAVGTAGDLGRDVAGNPTVQWAAAITTTAAVCLALAAGTACAGAALAYVGATVIKNKLGGNSDLLAGANPLDMVLSVGSAGMLDAVGAGASIRDKLAQGAYAGFMSDGASQTARHPGQLPNPCELGASTIGGAISNALPSGAPLKDIFFGGFISSGIGGGISAACDRLLP
jgi:RHS repeat-associated protein